MKAVIHHNPACGTSRNVLAALRDAGCDVTAVEYLQTGWTLPQLQALFAAAGLTARDALREKGSPAEKLGLLEPGVTEEAILAAMVVHPMLVNRPIVCTAKGVKLCRPSEMVRELI